MRIRVNNALFSTVSAVVLSLSAVTAVYAYEAPDVAPEQVSELDTLIVTARGKPRTVLDSAVPVDAFSADDLKAAAFTDTNDIL